MLVSSRRNSVLAVLLAALLSCWPAWMNRYPLLYADSLSYLGDGQFLLAQLLHRTGTFVGMRSELYALIIYFTHWQRSPWPVVLLHALITAYIVFITVRAFFPQRTIQRYLALMIVLSALTTMSWYVTLIMPDILGAPLYLAIGLLLFAPQSLTRFDRIMLPLLMWFCMVSHATHLLMAAFLLAMLTVLLLLRRPIMQHRSRALLQIAVVFLIAVTSQMALHKYLYGHATLDGNRLPYLTARFVADGPAKLYLRTHCGAEHWMLCAHLDQLPSTDDDFIWGDDTIWTRASKQEKQELLQEELPLISHTLRAYPKQQIAISLGSFFSQLNDFGVNDFDNNTWMEDNIETTMQGAHAVYERSLQAHDRVPSELFTQLQRWPIYLAAILLAVLLPSTLRRKDLPLLGFCIVIVPTLIANAFVVATLSEVDSRYQARVIWLLPLLTAIALWRWWDSRPTHARSNRVIRAQAPMTTPAHQSE
jgi:hypothetical protein